MNQYYVKYSYKNWNNKEVQCSGFFYTSLEVLTDKDVIEWAEHNIYGGSSNIKIISISNRTDSTSKK